VHGYRVTIKERTLKRGSSLLKHARFLSNLEVTPMFPQPIDPVVVDVVSEIQETEDN